MLILLIFLSPLQVFASEITESWSFSVGGSIQDVIVEDVDGDTLPDVVLFFKHSNIYELDYLYVLDRNGNVKWYRELDNIHGIYVSDFGHEDGKKKIVVSYGKTREKIERARLLFLDGKGDKIMEYPDPKFGYMAALYQMAALDTDKNGYMELIGGTVKGVYAIDDRFQHELWRSITGEDIKEFIVADIDKDGEREIIAKSIGTIYNIKLINGKINWETEIGDHIIEVNISANETIKRDIGIDIIRVGNIDSRPRNEVIAILPSDIFFVYDYGGSLIGVGGDIDTIKEYVKNYSSFRVYNVTEGLGNTTTVNLFDFDEDGVDELVIGSNQGFYVIHQLSDEKRFYPTGKVKDITVESDQVVVFTGYAIYKLGMDEEIKERYNLNRDYQRLYMGDVDGKNGDEIILTYQGNMTVYRESPTPITTTVTTVTTTSSIITTIVTSSTSTVSSTSVSTTIPETSTSTVNTVSTTLPSEGAELNIIDIVLIFLGLLLVATIVRYGTVILGRKEKKKRKKPVKEERKKELKVGWEELAEEEEAMEAEEAVEEEKPVKKEKKEAKKPVKKEEEAEKPVEEEPEKPVEEEEEIEEKKGLRELIAERMAEKESEEKEGLGDVGWDELEELIAEEEAKKKKKGETEDKEE